MQNLIFCTREHGLQPAAARVLPAAAAAVLHSWPLHFLLLNNNSYFLIEFCDIIIANTSVQDYTLCYPPIGNGKKMFAKMIFLHNVLNNVMRLAFLYTVHCAEKILGLLV
jgi:hypothetical protein